MLSLTSSPSAAPLARPLGTLLVLLFGMALVLGGPISAAAFGHLNAHGHAHLHAHGHPFADARSWLGIPNTSDVLSNLPFILLGLWVVGRSGNTGRSGHSGRSAAAKVLGLGLLLTGFGSGLYHWVPDAHTLVADRLGMAVAFAGALTLATHSLLGAASTRLALLTLLPAGALAALLPALDGNLLPWIVIQFGGLLWLALAAWAPRQAGAVPVRWVWVMAGYAIAKGLEMHDTELFLHSGGWVSGHTLKHLVAAPAVLPIVLALQARHADR